jgi:hypothetical protein
MGSRAADSARETADSSKLRSSASRSSIKSRVLCWSKMTTADEGAWKLHEKEQRITWLRLTPAQRLAWLEEAKRFVEAAKRARKIAEAARQSQTKRA